MAEQIYTARTALGWSQGCLAIKAGLAKSTISDLEAGRRKNPGIITLGKIAKALGISLAELLRKES